MAAWSPSMDAPKGVIRALADGARRPAKRLLVLEGLATRTRGCWWRHVADVDYYAEAERMAELEALDVRAGWAVVLRDDPNTELVDAGTGDVVWNSREAAGIERAAARSAQRALKRLPIAEGRKKLRDAVRAEAERRRALGLRRLTARTVLSSPVGKLADELGLGSREAHAALVAATRPGADS